MSRKAIFFWLFIGVSAFAFKACDDKGKNNEWGSKFGNENVRKSTRDEMIRGGTDPKMADEFTKLKYEEEKENNRRK